MILIIAVDGGVQQHQHELTQEQIQGIERGDFRAFRYDHIQVSYLEASPDQAMAIAHEEGGQAAADAEPRTITWQPLPK